MLDRIKEEVKKFNKSKVTKEELFSLDYVFHYIPDVDDAFVDFYGYFVTKIENEFILFPLDVQRNVLLDEIRYMDKEHSEMFKKAIGKYAEKVESYRKREMFIFELEKSVEIMKEMVKKSTH